ncbi:esterase FE4-like [Pararge aegeria]|uniref:Carboxylic ester hydrolase n=1 Tax=Pararge aegeria aegeria TaxID=348720 RepID=A0A8S4S594_9NEOP|nr:esterase FE4-like [Pararge aegeria]CAH2252348.1 jg2006 [Pararge aegeria aegeria]
MNVFDWIYPLLLRIINIQVDVNEGILEGQVVVNPYGSPYFSFKGIPYAEPPVGDLRFKAPQPKKPWKGVLNAKEHASNCYHYELFANETTPPVGSEDCLYLNVYTPNLVPVNLLPVMVWIHGGGFISGSGDDNEHGPQYLIRKGVILVTLNYRLEILGFLSLDTEDIPGNAGMKDQVAALRWVKDNIRKFGGDPDNITIFGESAGGASVSLHLVSPMTKGLFKRAIMQSGTVTGWLTYTFRARDKAILLARDLGCHSNDLKEIYEFFKSQPVKNLIRKEIRLSYAALAKASPNFLNLFAVVSETQFGNDERFYYGDSYDLARNGIHEGVEIMNGYTEDEGVIYFSAGLDIDHLFDQANKFLELFVPLPFTRNTPLVEQLEIGSRFKEFYLKNNTVSRDNVDDLLRYLNMELFVYGAISMQKIVAKHNNNKNYFYKFTCKSELNLSSKIWGLDGLFSHRPLTAHADDVGYLFPSIPEEVIDMNSNTFKMIDQVTTLWTNFAKHGDPTPDDGLGTKWLPFTVENEEYLDIGEILIPKTYPDKEEIEFWESIFKEFLPHYVP